MAYPYSVFKTYVDGETLTASDLNSTDTNHINNNIPESMDDYSASVAEQRTTSDPDLDGSGNAPTTLSEELEGLRHQLARMSTLLIGGTYWYNLVSTTVINAPAGSAAAPVYSFAGDPDSGMYNAAANQLGFGVSGINILTLSTSTMVSAVVNQTVAGAVGIPAYSFSGDSDTGMYNVSANALGFASGGIQIAQIDGAGIKNTDGGATAPSFTFIGDTNTGAFSAGADAYGISAGGAESFRVDATGTAGNTRLLIYDIDNGALERVSVGAADSGGSGFKVLRIPN